MKLISIVVAASLSGMLGAAAWADTAPAPGVAPPPPSRAALAGACKQDIELLCPGVKAGGGRIAECFRSQFAKLSPGCKSALRESRLERQAASAPAPMRPATAPPPAQ